MMTSNSSEEKVDSCSEKSELGNPLYCSYVDGVYTYKDPGTEKEFRWDDNAKQWKPKKSKLINCTTTTTGQTGISMSTDGGGTNDNWRNPPPTTTTSLQTKQVSLSMLRCGRMALIFPVGHAQKYC